jgi:hypothetical protein
MDSLPSNDYSSGTPCVSKNKSASETSSKISFRKHSHKHYTYGGYADIVGRRRTADPAFPRRPKHKFRAARLRANRLAKTRYYSQPKIAHLTRCHTLAFRYSHKSDAHGVDASYNGTIGEPIHVFCRRMLQSIPMAQFLRNSGFENRDTRSSNSRRKGRPFRSHARGSLRPRHHAR